MAPTRRSARSDAPVADTAGEGVEHVADKTRKTLDNVADETRETLEIVADKGHKATDEIAAVVEQSKPSRSGCGGLSAVLHFPIVAALSFCMASLGYSLVGELSKGQLAALSRSQDTWGEVAVLAGWRLTELALAWFGSLDALDVAMLDLLSHGPTLFLMTAFYSLSPNTAVSALLVDVLAAAVPFAILRPLSNIHRPSAKVPNRELIDLSLQMCTTAMSTGIYTVILVLSLRFLLPRILILHFSGLPTLEPAYTASYSAVLPATAIFGAAASAFIFAPFATTGKSAEDEAASQFDPVTASLKETVRWNVWGYTTKTKVIVRRTAAVMLLTGVNTYLACTKTMYGVESCGAIWYAAVWVVAALFTGVGLGLVGGD
ncbi:hypothetical protein HIM_08804 [Hirsutella minnesotensis 3608]|uniref:Uncharacterized protein n=1 Tax=Hirsutella minnesotensis 3608 TaxID=1043627 RepID=A0A0F8A3G4_9HYPO|nr:hypothetical protein HIM_08804 [Hirsutella minnesotensis 3608]